MWKNQAPSQRYVAAMTGAGLVDAQTTSRNAWFREQAKIELERLRGPLHAAAVGAVGEAYVAKKIRAYEAMNAVLETGEHCPTRLRARKPLSNFPRQKHPGTYLTPGCCLPADFSARCWTADLEKVVIHFAKLKAASGRNRRINERLWICRETAANMQKPFARRGGRRYRNSPQQHSVWEVFRF